jgi:hypothetical protein
MSEREVFRLSESSLFPSHLSPLGAIFNHSSNLCSYSVQFQQDDSNQFFANVTVTDVNNELSSIVWKKLKLSSFELIHRVTRIILLLPDKFATALAICKEQIPGETGEFLIDLVLKLLEDTLTEGQQRNSAYHSAFIATISGLIQELEEIKLCIRFSRIDDANILILSFLKKCDLVYETCCLYIKFCHSEVLHLQRTGNFSILIVYKFLLIATISNSREKNVYDQYVQIVAPPNET